MVKIILQPTGKDIITDAEEIIGKLNLTDYKQFIDKSDFNELSKLYKDGKASFWSITPGERKVSKWERIVPGDVVLFSQKGFIVASATITFKFHNNLLGTEREGFDDQGDTYEYFYFFDYVKNQKIDIKDFNKAAGYNSGNVIRGFEVLNDDVSKNILSTFPEIKSEKENTDYFSAKLKQLLSTKCQIILYGPPGTGKTYNARKFAVEFISWRY